MAQASSAQREPSMEEILSSIRRIIEDSDAGTKAAEKSLGGSGSEKEAPASEPAAIVDDMTPIASGGPARVERAPVQQTSLAEIQSRIAAPHVTEDEQDEHAQPETESKADDAFSDDVEIFDTLDAGQADSESNDTAAENDAAAEEVQAIVQELTEKTESAGSASDIDEEWAEEFAGDIDELSSDAGEDDREVHAGAVTMMGAPGDGAKAILSPETERQVAASFEELSKAFISSRAESYDKMAEDLMRPMLQEWLDNNLPTLVERLVREEIERVARSGAGK